MQWFKKNRQLESYQLDFVAQTYGAGAKDDVEYSQIGELFKTPEGRRKLALYWHARPSRERKASRRDRGV